MKRQPPAALLAYFAPKAPPAAPAPVSPPQPSAAQLPDAEWLARAMAVGEIRQYLDAANAHDAVPRRARAWEKARRDSDRPDLTPPRSPRYRPAA